MNDLREEISLWLDGLLPEERVLALRRRLDADPAARREYETMRRAVETLRALPSEAAPGDLLRRIEAAAASRPPRRGRLLLLGAAAAVAAGLLLSLRLLVPQEPPRETAERLARRPEREVQDQGGAAEAERPGPAEAPGAPVPEAEQAEAGAEREKVSMGSPRGRPGGAAPGNGKKEPPAKGERPLRLLDLPPSGPERAEYLRRVEAAPPEAFRKALAATGEAKTLAGPVWSFRVASAGEAKVLRGALERAFPAPPSPEPEARVTIAGVRRMEELRILATEAEAGRIASWLERFEGTTSAAAKAPGVSVREDGVDGDEARKPRLFRLRLVYEMDEGK